MRNSILSGLTGLVVGWLAFSNTTSQAQVATKPTEWAYLCVDQRRDQFDATTLTAFLNEKGKAGWELCDIVGEGQTRMFVFQKRN